MKDYLELLFLSYPIVLDSALPKRKWNFKVLEFLTFKKNRKTQTSDKLNSSNFWKFSVSGLKVTTPINFLNIYILTPSETNSKSSPAILPGDSLSGLANQSLHGQLTDPSTVNRDSEIVVPNHVPPKAVVDKAEAVVL